jgi:TonB family protein
MNWTRVVIRVATVGVLVCAMQTTLPAETAKRQALVHPDPIYPSILKRYNVGGVVKIEIVVAPDGKVKTATLKGGDATLGQSALETVRLWKYTPADSESVLSIEFRFNP